MGRIKLKENPSIADNRIDFAVMGYVRTQFVYLKRSDVDRDEIKRAVSKELDITEAQVDVCLDWLMLTNQLQGV